MPEPMTWAEVDALRRREGEDVSMLSGPSCRIMDSLIATLDATEAARATALSDLEATETAFHEIKVFLENQRDRALRLADGLYQAFTTPAEPTPVTVGMRRVLTKLNFECGNPLGVSKWPLTWAEVENLAAQAENMRQTTCNECVLFPDEVIHLIALLRQTEAARVAAVDQRDRALRLLHRAYMPLSKGESLAESCEQWIGEVETLQRECGAVPGEAVQR